MNRALRQGWLPIWLVVALLTGGWQAPQPGGGADWTVLLYFAGDNNIEADLMGNAKQIGQVGSSPRVNVILQFDRSVDDGDDDPLYNLPNWSGAKRLKAEKGSYTELADLGDVNMASGATLRDFIKWGVAAYPARHYALVINDHGGSWRGCCEDDSYDPRSLLTLPDMAQGLRDAGTTFDLLGFDACLMASVEVALEMQPFAKTMVASMEVTFGPNFDYTGMIGRMNDTPEASGLDIGRGIVDGYMANARRDSAAMAAYNTFSVVDLTAMAPVEQAFGRFVGDLDRYVSGPGEVTAAQRLDRLGIVFGRARSQTPAFWRETYKDPGLVFDLGDLAENVGKATGDAPLTRDAAELIIALKGAVPYVVAGDSLKQSPLTGLTLFVPYAKLLPSALNRYNALDKIAGTRWPALINRFVEARGADRTPPVVAAPQADRARLQPGDVATITDRVTEETMLAEVTVSVVSLAGQQPVLLMRDPQPATFSTSADVSYVFDGTAWYLDDGSRPQPVLTMQWRPGQRAVFGVFKPSGTNRNQGRAVMIYDEQSGELVAGYYQLDWLAGAIQPRPIATFQPSLYTPNLTPIETRSVLAKSAKLRRLALPAGAYQIGVTGIDIAGNHASSDVTVTLGRAPDVAPTCQPDEGDDLARVGAHPLRFRLGQGTNRTIPLQLDRNRIGQVQLTVESYGEDFVYADPDDPESGPQSTTNYSDADAQVFFQLTAPDGTPMTRRQPVDGINGFSFTPKASGAYQLHLLNQTPGGQTLFVTVGVVERSGVALPDAVDLDANPSAAAALATPGLHQALLTVPAGKVAAVALPLDAAKTPQFGYSLTVAKPGITASFALSVTGPDGKARETSTTCGAHAGGFAVDASGTYTLRLDNTAGGADVPLSLWLEGYGN